MEKLILSRINPYVSARCAVNCGSCGTPVKPAMSIERGYAVEAVSLVEPLQSHEMASPLFITTDKITGKAVIGESKPKSTLPDDKAENIEVDDKLEAIPQVNDVTYDKLPDSVEDDSDTDSDETLVQKNSSESDTIVQKNGSGGDRENLDEFNGEEDWKDADAVKEIYVVSPSKYRGIKLALDKLRFCLQKTNCTTLKRSKEISEEAAVHLKAIKKLVEENIPKQGSTLIDDLIFISMELFKNVETLKYHMLDCQVASLLDTVLTLQKDLKTEMTTVDEKEQSEKELSNDIELATTNTDPLMNLLKDAPLAFFAFISMVGANLGYFSQPWLFQSFHSSFMKFAGYLRNGTFF